MPKNKLLLILFLLIFTFSFTRKANAEISQQIVNVIVGNFIDDGESGVGGGPLPSCGEIDQKLKEDFGVIIQEGGGGWESSGNSDGTERVNCDTRQKIYRAYSIPGRSSSWMRLLKPNITFRIECYRDSSDPESSAGFVNQRNRMQFKNCSNISIRDFEPYAFLFLHETGHIIKHRNYREIQDGFPRTALYNSDRNCFAAEEPVIKTYNRRDLTDYSLTSESSAEAIALYVYNKKRGRYASISNFRNECPEIYNWARNKVYGGYTFN